MSLNLPLKWQIPVLTLIFVATCLPASITLYRQSQVQLVQQNEIAQKDAAINADTTEALRRAERCILIDKRYPLVEGGNAYYDINSKTKRLLPTGTALCSPVSGNTAIVDATGGISDIKSAPVEQITRILKQRGLI